MSIENKYCVYTHDTLDGTPFYVGSGTLERAKLLRLSDVKSKERGKRYSEKIKSLEYKYTYTIHKELLSKEESSKAELDLYYELLSKGLDLVNSRVPNSQIKMSEVCFDSLYYDPASFTGLRWKVVKKSSNRKPGDIAGGRTGTKGCQVHYGGRLYYTHRVVMILHGINVDGFVVDHVNGNPFDNRFENLRLCSQAENTRNRRRGSNNTSGVTGVTYDSHDQQWCATIRANGLSKTRTFNVSKYGYDGAFELACKVRKEMLESLGLYSERHGTIT